jgi:hypothetical protein
VGEVADVVREGLVVVVVVVLEDVPEVVRLSELEVVEVPEVVPGLVGVGVNVGKSSVVVAIGSC